MIGLRLFKLKVFGSGPKLLSEEDEVEVETDGSPGLEDDV